MRVADLTIAVEKANVAMVELEQVLNRADAQLGDGDTGGMLARVLATMAAQDLKSAGDLGTAFSACARAALAATGSSLGTLIATALMRFARATAGKTEMPWSEFSGLLADARDAMMARGGASLGDKTVLDALDAVVRATAGLSEPDRIAQATRSAAQEALSAFRDRPCKIGRARMFSERSVGIDDPGMLAFHELAERVLA